MTVGFAWRRSMAGQVFLLLLVGIAAAAVLAFAASNLQVRQAELRGREQRLIDRIADLAAYLDHTPQNARATSLGIGPEALRLMESGTPIGPKDAALSQRLASQLQAGAAPDVSAVKISGCAPAAPRAPPPPPPAPVGAEFAPKPPAPPPPLSCRLAAFSLPSGERIVVSVPTGPALRPDRLILPNPAYLAVVAVAAALLAFVVAQLATAPLRRLSTAARNLGRDLEHAPLPVEGSLEVRAAAAAFNAMQERLKLNLDERMHMLAAITHDLRTPLTRQRLRLERVADPDLRAQLLADQSEMQALIQDGLDLARASGDNESDQRLDIDSLLASLCEDASDAGSEVTVTATCGRIVATRPQALKRAISNLLDNALTYAGAAELSAEADGAAVVIKVRDNGPGIPEDQLDAALSPYVQLDGAEPASAGGVGLGLAIARILAGRAGGALTLTNRPEGGLDATLRIETREHVGKNWRARNDSNVRPSDS